MRGRKGREERERRVLLDFSEVQNDRRPKIIR